MSYDDEAFRAALQAAAAHLPLQEITPAQYAARRRNHERLLRAGLIVEEEQDAARRAAYLGLEERWLTPLGQQAQNARRTLLELSEWADAAGAVLTSGDLLRRVAGLLADLVEGLPPVDSNHEAPGSEPGGSASSPRGHQPGRDAARIREHPALLGDGAEPCPSPGRHQQPTDWAAEGERLARHDALRDLIHAQPGAHLRNTEEILRQAEEEIP